MSIELKPCPFCGGEPRLVEEISLAKVACMNRGCDVEPETPWFWSVDEAAEAWNTRAERTCRNMVEDGTGFKCSECEAHISAWWITRFPRFSFCPNCGAKVVEV